MSKQDLQQRFWESQHDFRDYHHPIVRFFARQRWQYLSQFVPFEKIKLGLDVGCGGGFSNIYAQEHFPCIGCDYSAYMLTQNQKSNILRANAEKLPFKDKSFDLVFCWELLHHIDKPMLVINEMARVSRNWVIVFEPNPFNPAQLIFALFHPEHRGALKTSKTRLRQLTAEALLRPLVVDTVGFIFPNKTPNWLFRILKILPFRILCFGISNVLVAQKETERSI